MGTAGRRWNQVDVTLARTAAAAVLAFALAAATGVAAGPAHAYDPQPSAPLTVLSGTETVVDISTALTSTPVLRVVRTSPAKATVLFSRQKARRAALARA